MALSNSTAPLSAHPPQNLQSVAFPFQNLAATISVVLFSLLALLVKTQWQPAFSKAAPQRSKDSYPMLGALKYFTERHRFCIEASARSKSGNFSFYFGKHRIVGLSGLEGRRAFFESKSMDMSEGYAVLFTIAPSYSGVHKQAGEAIPFSVWFNRTIIKLMKKENFVRNLNLLTDDTAAALNRIVKRANSEGTGMLDPFDDIYRIVYRLTMRTVGATEIAESPELLAKTLALFEEVEQQSSPARIIFSWLPTVGHIRQMIAGGRLFMILDKLIKERKLTGKTYEDAVQYLLDTGEDTVRILGVVIGSLFAGQLNSGINAAWLFCYLATNREWYERVQTEVDAAVRRHRSSASQAPADVLSTLTLDEWESEFPNIDLCLRECIRFQLVGTAFRKNIGRHDVPIGSTGEVVPRDNFAVYLVDQVHFDPNIYSNPNDWDPGRFLPERAEDKKQPLSYVGWGVGRHPCLGMRFAKLEMGIIGALFVAMFDYELCDIKGNRLAKTPPTDRNRHAAHKPAVPMRLKYTLRHH